MPCPPPRDLSDAGMNPHLLCLTSCALADWLFTTELPGKTLPAGKENLDDLESGEGTPPLHAPSVPPACVWTETWTYRGGAGRMEEKKAHTAFQAKVMVQVLEITK